MQFKSNTEIKLQEKVELQNIELKIEQLTQTIKTDYKKLTYQKQINTIEALPTQIQLKHNS